MPKPLFTSKEALSNKEKEWRHHRAHALCGAYVLGHFVFRHTLFWFEHELPDMGFGDSETPFFLLFLPHLILQLSGFGFQLPSKRHPDGNRIWGEYRWHALVFFCRCMALLFLAWSRKKRVDPVLVVDDEESTARLFFPLSKEKVPAAIVFFLNILCVDYITAIFQSRGESSHTIRGLKGCSPALKYVMSVSQFHANVSCLLTTDKMNVQFAALTVVQSSAFGMTLRRKGLIGQEQGLFLYSLLLLLGMLIIVQDLLERQLLFAGLSIGNMAAILRIDFGIHKYVLWCVVGLLVLPFAEEYAQHPLWLYSFLGSSLALMTSSMLRGL